MNYVQQFLAFSGEALRPLPLLRRLRLFAGAGQAHEDLRLVGALDFARDRRGARGREGPLVDGLEAAALVERARGGVRLDDVEQRRVVAACFVEGVEQGRRDLC